MCCEDSPSKSQVVNFSTQCGLSNDGVQVIKPDIIPVGTRVDAEYYEGGNPDNYMPLLIGTEPQTATSTTHPSILQAQPPLGNVTNMHRIKLPLPNVVSAIGCVIQGTDRLYALNHSNKDSDY